MSSKASEMARAICRTQFSGAHRVDDAQHIKDVEQALLQYHQEESKELVEALECCRTENFSCNCGYFGENYTCPMHMKIEHAISNHKSNQEKA